MREFFKEYKKYIVKHPKVAEYKPTSFGKFNSSELAKVVDKLKTKITPADEDFTAIADFVNFSEYLHDNYDNFYKVIKDNLIHLNLKGIDIAEFFIAALNREFKVVINKRKELIQGVKKGTYFLSDLMNFKIQSANPDIGLLDARGALECETDSISLILNYLRHFLDDELTTEDANPEQFAARIRHSLETSQSIAAIKHSYDDILYNDGYIKIENEGKQKLINFNYESYNNLRLLFAGDMMFSERRVQVMSNYRDNKQTPRLFKFISKYRIKKAKVDKGCIYLNFGQGNAKEFKMIVSDMQFAVDAFYEFLDGNSILHTLACSTIDEAISIWSAVQYIAQFVVQNINYDVELNTKDDFQVIPCKILKSDLIAYINKLTGIQANKINAVLGALEADWSKYNDIWSAMLYPVRDHYLLPFYPLIYSSPYNVIDKLLLKGGFNLDERGKQFENFLYRKISGRDPYYPVKCLPASKYGESDNQEEIDLIVSLKNVVFVADAKCIHYSVEPQNYADAWDRLQDGCEQVLRKVQFIINNPEYFKEIGDYSSKKFIPFVVTNYPTFTGFSHKGVYIIDSHSFLSYLQCGIMSVKILSESQDPIIGCKTFYSNEDEFSYNFQDYLSNNPVKQQLMNRILIHNLPLHIDKIKSFKIISKSAQLDNDPQFNISSNPTHLNC